MHNGQLQILWFLINVDEIWKARNHLLRGELHQLNLIQITHTAIQRSHAYAYVLKLDIDQTDIHSSYMPHSFSTLPLNYIITFDGSFQNLTMKGGWFMIRWFSHLLSPWFYFRL